MGGPGFKFRPGDLYLDGDTSLFSLALPGKCQDAAVRGYFVLHPSHTNSFRTKIFSILHVNKTSVDSRNRTQFVPVRRTNWLVLHVWK
jgi:hypothetical protein